MLFTLLQAGYYAEPASGAAHYSAATMGMFVLIIVIGIAGYAVQARLQSVFRKYSKVQFPGGLTGAEVAEKMLRDNNIHNVKVTPRGRKPDRPLQPADDDRQPERQRLFVDERRSGSRGGARVRARRATCPGLRPPDAALAVGTHPCSSPRPQPRGSSSSDW